MVSVTKGKKVARLVFVGFVPLDLATLLATIPL